MFFLLAFIIFLAAYLGAGYYVWRVPEQEAEQMLSHRLRELRASVRARAQAPSGLIRTEQRGTFAFLGDFVEWLGMLRRLQEYIAQADLKYRAADVLGLMLVLLVGTFLLLEVFGLKLLLLRLLVALAAAALPLVYILRVRARRLRKFEENLPDAIDLFTRTRSEEHTSELQSRFDLVCRLLLGKKESPPTVSHRRSGMFCDDGSSSSFRGRTRWRAIPSTRVLTSSGFPPHRVDSRCTIYSCRLMNALGYCHAGRRCRSCRACRS